MIRMQEREISPEKDEQLIRIQSAQLIELKHVGEKLREEIRSVRQSRDDNKHALELCEANKEESCMQLRAKVSLANAERVTMEHRLSNSITDIERKDASIRAAKHDIEQLTNQLDELRKHAHHVENKHTGEALEHTADLQLAKQHYESEVEELMRQLSQVE